MLVTEPGGKRMKVAYVYDAVYPWEKGGGQKRVWEIAHRLANDHDVHIYGMHYWDGPPVIERDGITYHGVCKPKELYVQGRRSITQALYFAANVGPSLRAEQFDIIDCQAWPLFPIFLVKVHEILRRSTLVVTWFEVWDDYWYEYLGYKGIFGKCVERITVRLPTEIITLSDFLKENLERIGRKKNISVVHNGVDFHDIQAISAAETDWDIIYVGRLSEHKKVDVLLEAIAKVAEQKHPIQCGIIGDGPERNALERKTDQLGLTNCVEFLGFVEEEETVIANLKAAKMFVLPSIREGFPNTILEAGACATPSIVVDHPENGGKAVVRDGATGYITPLSADSIADHITKLMENDELRTRLSEGAHRFAADHDWSHIAAQIEEVYANVHK